jgi:hypothetical protein
MPQGVVSKPGPVALVVWHTWIAPHFAFAAPIAGSDGLGRCEYKAMVRDLKLTKNGASMLAWLYWEMRAWRQCLQVEVRAVGKGGGGLFLTSLTRSRAEGNASGGTNLNRHI